MSAEVIHDPRALTRSRHTSTFAHMGEVYLYHDLYGFILKMSPDILEFLQAFRTPTDPEKVCSKFGNAFGEQTPESFVGIFQQFKCLVTPGEDELDGLWDMVGVPGPWNVWRLEEDGGLTFFTAWGDRPVSTHRLSAAEAGIWKRMDGEARLSALAGELGEAEVAALVVRLAHHDVQALKLSGVGLSFFKGRQHMQPPYLTSTMPYAAYDPDTDPAPVPLGDLPTPETYYRHRGRGRAVRPPGDDALAPLSRPAPGAGRPPLRRRLGRWPDRPRPHRGRPAARARGRRGPRQGRPRGHRVA